MGRTLVELAQEVERQENAKKDYIADTGLLSLEVAHGEGSRPGTNGPVPEVNLIMKNGKTSEFSIGDVFHEQLGSKLNITRPYYDKMRNEAPELLAHNVNHWLHQNPEPRMVRTLDGKARAFLSDKFRTLDNYDMLEAVLPTLKEHKMQFISCEVTEKRMYLKVLFPNVQADVVPKDTVQAGLVVSNSEVGAGSFKVEPFTYRLICSNGLISEYALRKFHVGRQQGGDDNDEIYEILSNAAKSADDKALFLKVRDIVNHSLKPEVFNANVEKFREATTKQITGDVPAVVEVTRRKFGLSQDQGASMLRHLIQGGDLSQWGLTNAVTATAKESTDYDNQTWLERAGGKIIELSNSEWTKLATAN
jgi:hypothetical protein